jgi:hypothetical protein
MLMDNVFCDQVAYIVLIRRRHGRTLARRRQQPARPLPSPRRRRSCRRSLRAQLGWRRQGTRLTSPPLGTLPPPHPNHLAAPPFFLVSSRRWIRPLGDQIHKGNGEVGPISSPQLRAPPMVALAPPNLPGVRSIPTRSDTHEPRSNRWWDARCEGRRRPTVACKGAWRQRQSAPPSSTTGLRTTTACTAISSISVEDSSAAYPWVLRLVGCHLMLHVLLEVPG